MNLSVEVQDYILNDVIERFLRYVKVWTTSDDESSTKPSSSNQLELAKILVEELKELDLENIILDKFGYVYADLPPSMEFEKAQPIGLIAHLDTSNAVSGEDVKPIVHKNYQGGPIKLPNVEDLYITLEDAPELEEYIGLDIITSSGDTLLGADDKAGIAEIMTACKIWQKYPEFKHGPITICFTPDEEIGKGTDNINKSRLPEACYTLDGGKMGELEYECFDAWKATFKFIGLSVHPGHAKNKMINAIHIASRFFSNIPESESPEHTEEREGFFHLSDLKGNEEAATAKLLIRDHDSEKNKRRIDYIKSLKNTFEVLYPGLKIEIDLLHQYKNMLFYLEKDKHVIEIAKKAIEESGLEVDSPAIRGGTDGARLSEMGIPTPNIFGGGSLFHSRKEFIPTLGLLKATEVILNLAHLWSLEQKK
ncbi:MAG: peptidase T [Candidatus Lokiarchaeota archaeon]|nr:peptidase T [Candidatus Lokiarchaeota archaeon]